MQGRVPPIGGAFPQTQPNIQQDAATSPVAPQPAPVWVNPPPLAVVQRALVIKRPTMPHPPWMYTR